MADDLSALTDSHRLALRMVRSLGFEPVVYPDGDLVYAVIGLGAGITMAYVDDLLLRRQIHPPGKVRPIVLDLVGGYGLAARIVAMDYMATAFPTALLLWCSLASADRYLEGLLERGFDPRAAGGQTEVYLRGLGQENAARWQHAGFTLLSSLCPGAERLLQGADSCAPSPTE